MSNGSNGKQAARRSFGRHRKKVPRSNLNCTAIGDGLVTVVSCECETIEIGYSCLKRNVLHSY